MEKSLELSPFPPLEWDGSKWLAQITIPGFAAGQSAALIVDVKGASARQQKAGPSASEPSAPLPFTPEPAATLPLPTDAQRAAFQYLLDSGSQVWAALVAAVQGYDSDHELFDQTGAPLDLEFGSVVILTSEWQGVSYTGFRFSSFDTWVSEHGLGVIAHRERSIYVGMAGEATDDGIVTKDIRRLKNSLLQESLRGSG